jgi:hypothetical protein
MRSRSSAAGTGSVRGVDRRERVSALRRLDKTTAELLLSEESLLDDKRTERIGIDGCFGAGDGKTARWRGFSVTRQSGKKKQVVMRYGCNGRLREALYHWSRISVQK